ncbi:formyltransferase family protein [Candidatus Izemoplasma sp. B36]|uniref:formyltransferase family protein n=1 Tax=Candidatus Izemoplasma sp. B36 TaxID=3242468 RepID=UPI00355624A4
MYKFKTVVIGSVKSSQLILEGLLKNNINIDLVCSVSEKYSNNISGYVPIHETAKNNNIPYLKFRRITEEQVYIQLKNLKPDYIFVVGLSQIVPPSILALADRACIGFHPTPLPKLRGRAAIPWQLLLQKKSSKISFFILDENMDSGDIIIQQNYKIFKKDYACDVHNTIQKAIVKAIPRLISKLYYRDSLIFKRQNQSKATYLMARRPIDGLINWNDTPENIYDLIRATSKPYPGAYTYYKGVKIVIWKADIVKNKKYIGFNGQIAKVNNSNIYIISGKKIINIVDYYAEEKLKFVVGSKFNNGK